MHAGRFHEDGSASISSGRDEEKLQERHGSWNTHSARIALTEAARDWMGPLEKGEPFAMHCPSGVCIWEPKGPHW